MAFSGLKKVEYSTDVSGAFTSPVDLGAPLTDGSFTPDIPEVETSDGKMLYAGKKQSIEHNFTDMSKYSALETIMKADTPIAVRYTFIDATTEIVINDGLCKVKKNYKLSVGDRNSFNFKAQEFTT